MVQAVENLTAITGRVVSRQRHPRLDDYDIITLDLERTEAVPGKADLLGSQPLGPIEVTVRRSLLGGAGTGARLHCRAKRTPDGAMCEPHPDPGDFEIAP
jgi:hypothetical protein